MRISNWFAVLVFAVLVVLALPFHARAEAPSLADCRARIYEAYQPYAQVQARELTEAGRPLGPRVDLYRMRPDNRCGVELAEQPGYVRVVRFERADYSNPRQRKFEAFYGSAPQVLGIGKFETIKLDENDATYAGGRIKGRIGCSIDGDSVTYRTETPVFADGVRSPFAVTELKLKREGGRVSVSLTAGVSGAAWPFKSVTECVLGD